MSDGNDIFQVQSSLKQSCIEAELQLIIVEAELPLLEGFWSMIKWSLSIVIAHGCISCSKKEIVTDLID